MLKFLVKIFLIFMSLVVMLGIYAEYKKERFLAASKPIWTTSDKNENLYNFLVDKDKSMVLRVKGNDLLLIRGNHNSHQALFRNFKNKFDSLEMYYKDINQDGTKELIFEAELSMYKSALYVFSGLNKKVKKYKDINVFWDFGKLYFRDDGKMYVRSCGSQYCNDTYYLWDGVKLTKEYTDSYESM